MLHSIPARKITTSLFAITWLALLGQATAVGQPIEESKIYWIHPEQGIHRSSLDGSNVEPLVIPDLRSPNKFALDMVGGKMYWTEWFLDGIYRSDLDGSNLETLVEGTGYQAWNGITGIALDVAGGKMYWTERIFEGDYTSGILARANLDGSNFQVLTRIGSYPMDIALDVVQRKVYWTDDHKTYRADLDGQYIFNSMKIILSDSSAISSIAIDQDGGKMYWTNWSTPTINRADLDGQNREIVQTVSEGSPEEINLLDVDRGQIYWTNMGTQTIQRGDLDGKNVEHFFDLDQLYLTGSLTDIAHDLDGGKIYYTDSGPGGRDVRGTGTIQRIDLNGQNREVLFDPILRNPHGIALDRDKMYWTDVVKGTINRADLNGQNREVLFSGLNRPKDIALLDGNKIYWAAEGAGKIQAAGLDGSQIQDILTGLDRPKIIALDRDQSQIYWTNRDTVFRSNLDGSHHESIAPINMGFSDIALDRDRSRIYWTNRDTVFRSNLDGSHRENIVTLEHRERSSGGSNQAIVLDSDKQKIYWTGWKLWYPIDWHTPPVMYWKIFRSDMDGSIVEEVHVMEIFDSPSSDITLYIPHPTSVSAPGITPAEPTTSGLDLNFPNPFNASTQIAYRLATPGPVRLTIYNTLGNPVRTLVDQFHAAGLYQVSWDARDQRGMKVAAGVYFTGLHYPGGEQTRRLLLLK